MAELRRVLVPQGKAKPAWRWRLYVREKLDPFERAILNGVRHCDLKAFTRLSSDAIIQARSGREVNTKTATRMREAIKYFRPDLTIVP